MYFDDTSWGLFRREAKKIYLKKKTAEAEQWISREAEKQRSRQAKKQRSREAGKGRKAAKQKAEKQKSN